MTRLVPRFFVLESETEFMIDTNTLKKNAPTETVSLFVFVSITDAVVSRSDCMTWF